MPITSGSFEAKISIDIQQTWYFLYDFLRFFETSFQKNLNIQNTQMLYTNSSTISNKKNRKENNYIQQNVYKYDLLRDYVPR